MSWLGFRTRGKNNDAPSDVPTVIRDGNLYKFYTMTQKDRTTPKWTANIKPWTDDNFLAKCLRGNIYNSSNLIAGPTGAGKTVFISWLILNLIYAHRDKKFVIFIYTSSTEAETKLHDMQKILKDTTSIHIKRIDSLKKLYILFDSLRIYYALINDYITKGIAKQGTSEKEYITSKLGTDIPDDLLSTFSTFSDYIFYFDDCNDKFQNMDANTKSLISALQTTNRHFFSTIIYSLQNINVRLSPFCSNLKNLFIVGSLSEKFANSISKYPILSKIFGGSETNMKYFYHSLSQIFAQPDYTIQLFTSNAENCIRWGIMPSEYVSKMKIFESERVKAKRKCNQNMALDSSSGGGATEPSASKRQRTSSYNGSSACSNRK